ncbi:MAG: NADH-quinone oxidoreductase subunit H [Candidatus Heimdallarchaeum aukensis]|uniref:NADH-quinone oxidoreductase subunit H n=1 Tax=Candidatus Heimdallarchaeum aukensis TaxID=2876573 RepID=A0A9Y1FL43_9ARCH|nr:MAG: NADH-quinone oxidoreductase subunit H [Candidatus Heimdallarchaeum aukensis]
MNTDFLFIKVAVFPGVLFVLFGCLYLMYFERKTIARIHGRIGPQYVGYGGLLQTIADLMKLMFKEWIFPKTAKKAALFLTPIALFLLAFLPLSVVPWGENWYVADFSVTLIFAFVVIAAIPFLSLLLGWSSGSKYSLIGGYRAASQQIVFEVPLFLSALTPAILANSLSLMDITKNQKIWFLVLNPIAAFVFFVSMLAMMERQPFDIPEAESELVFGWKTELSGIFFGWSIFAGYTIMIGGSALFVVLFMGGFNGPGNNLGVLWFMLKLALIWLILFAMRAVLPRYRMDQILRMSWRLMIPLSLVSIGLSIGLLFAFPNFFRGV